MSVTKYIAAAFPLKLTDGLSSRGANRRAIQSVTISAQPISAVLTLDGSATGCSWLGSTSWATGSVFDAPNHANLGLGDDGNKPSRGVFVRQSLRPHQHARGGCEHQRDQ